MDQGVIRPTLDKGHRCCKRVYAGTFSGHPCKIPAALEKEGKWYCKRHDPAAVEARREKNSKAMMADIQRQMDAVENVRKQRAAADKDAERWRFLVKHWSSIYKGKPMHRYIEEDGLVIGGIEVIIDDAISVVKLRRK